LIGRLLVHPVPVPAKIELTESFPIPSSSAMDRNDRPSLRIARIFLPIYDHSWSSKALALSFRSIQAHYYTFPDQRPFQFSYGSNDREDHFAHWGTGIDTFAEADKLDAQRMKFFEHRNEVFSAPGEPVKPCNQNCIDFAFSGITHKAVEFGTAIFGAADADIDVLVHNFESTVPGIISEG